VPDFTSALYLGLAHEHASLRPWQQFTAGKPAVLYAMPGARSVAADLASLTGCEAATLAPSTLHLFTDLFLIWSHRSTAVYADGALYRTGMLGLERAAALGFPVCRFRHHDPQLLRRALRTEASRTPAIVTDGYCPCCGELAPVPAYLDCLGNRKGWVVIDDTQALGVLGRCPSPRVPLGMSGGGILRWFGIRDPRVILISSLAKAFGVPIAFLAGARTLVERFEDVSETRVHSSPISAPVLHAAEEAISFNENAGDRARGTLMQLILRLRRRLVNSPFHPGGGIFPVQSLSGTCGLPAEEIHKRLTAAEIQTVLQRHRISGDPQVAILLTARHTSRDIDKLANALLAMVDATPVMNCHV
jgi:8-amino-7-oxononanoate synthase